MTEKINILLVEDEDIQATYVKTLLDYRKYRVKHISDGRDAFNYLSSHTEPDVILMDYHLPSMNGVEIIQELSAKKINHNIVFVSAVDDIHTVIDAMRKGAQDFIVKTSPTFKTDLIHVIDKTYALQQRIKQQAILELQIKLSEENFRNLFNEMDVFLYIINQNGIILQINNTLCERLGFASDDIVGKPVAKLHPEIFTDEIPKLVEKMFLGSLKNYFIPFETSNGETFLVEITVNKSIWNNQSVILCNGKDNTELNYSEERFIKAFGANPSAMCISNLKGRFIDVNESFLKLTGFNRDEIIGRNFTDINIITHQVLQSQVFNILITQDHIREIEIPIKTKNGSNLYGILNADLININYEQCILIVINDITKRKEAELLIKQNEERLQLALKEGNNGLWDLNYQTGEMFVTSSVLGMLGYTESTNTINFKVMQDLVHPADALLSEKQMRNHIKGDMEFYETEQRLRKADGTYKWVLSRGKIVERDDSGIPLRIAGINIDIDSIKKMEQDLLTAKSQAETANITKTRFLANMSHEIRTPMTGVLGMSKLLRSTILDETQKEYLDMIISSAENLLVIINDILDFSKINEGKFQLNLTDFRISKFFADSVKTLSQLAQNKDLELKSYIDPNINDILYGDPIRLNQIIINLAGNAIKFTQTGYVEIKAELFKHEANTNHILFSVVDTGIGIDKENQEKIFEVFTQEDETVNRKFGGTGLGLAISRQLVEMMKGNIYVESTKGVGSKFSFLIPLPDGNKDNILETIETENKIFDLSKVKVLVAEDIKVNQFYIKSILSRWNINPDIVDNGRQAVEILRKESYDIVFMDKQMPEMSGIEATRAIRYKLNLDVPIIALTAAAMKNDKNLMLKAGMNDYISKPYSADDLLQKIIQFVSPDKISHKTNGTMSGDKTEHVKTNKVKSDIKRNYSLNNLKQLFDNDINEIKNLLVTVLETTPALVTDMETEFKQNYLLKVGQIAHKIKPTLDMLEVTSLTQTVREIEKLEKGIDIGENVSLLVENFISSARITLNQIREDFHNLS